MPDPIRRVNLTLSPGELIEALRHAGYCFPADAALLTVFHHRERDLVCLLVDSLQYNEVEPGAEAPVYSASAVLSGADVAAHAAAARAGGTFVPHPVIAGEQPARSIDRLRQADRDRAATAAASAALGDGGLGVGMAVST